MHEENEKIKLENRELWQKLSDQEMIGDTQNEELIRVLKNRYTICISQYFNLTKKCIITFELPDIITNVITNTLSNQELYVDLAKNIAKQIEIPTATSNQDEMLNIIILPMIILNLKRLRYKIVSLIVFTIYLFSISIRIQRTLLGCNSKRM